MLALPCAIVLCAMLLKNMEIYAWDLGIVNGTGGLTDDGVGLLKIELLSKMCVPICAKRDSEGFQ